MPESLLLCCPVCSSVDFQPLDTDKTVFGCRRCTLAIQSSFPANPIGIYRREEYDSRRMFDNAPRPSWSRFNHDRAVAVQRLRQLANVLPTTSGGPICITDFGCSTGAFLSAARAQGFSVRGVELDQAFCCEIAAITGIRVTPTADFLESPFAYPTNILTLFDVLEHLVDPVGVLKKATESLYNEPKLIVLELPDLGQHTGPLENFKHFKPDEHLTHWSAVSLDTMRALHFPNFKEVHRDIPLPGKLQVVWERK